ncbi:MAG: hypothetical protein RMJ36_04550 [Candidatus Calescibacterium sp.]|nr:hypothetical protein [Candidatus Calescibacterium sp.]MDW8132904.1 hypothetical protein [Candidatus Calescibacterium sp.]
MYICPRASNCLLKIIKHFEQYFNRLSVYLPANICYTFPLSLTYSKARIRLYDIDFENLYPNFSQISEEIRKSSEKDEFIIFVCVIPYGNWEDQEISKNRSLIKKIFGDSIFIIWDCALTLLDKNKLSYIHNNLTEKEGYIFSFSYAKPLELGFGSILFTKLKINHTFPNIIDRNLSSFLINRVDKIFKTFLAFEKVSSKKQSFLCYNSELHIQDTKYIYQIIENIAKGKDFFLKLRKNDKSSFYELIENRKKNNQFLKNNLGKIEIENNQIEFLDKDDLSWRFNIRVKRELRDKIIDEVFKNGAFASRLFPNIHKFVNNSEKNKYDNTSKHWQQIINIFNNQNNKYNHIIIKSIEEVLKNELKLK